MPIQMNVTFRSIGTWQIPKQQGNAVEEQIPAPTVTNPQEVLKKMTDVMKEREQNFKQMNQELDIHSKQMEEEKDKMKVMLTCLEISRRIMAGDKVPLKDQKYLLKHDPELYAKSISMRFPKNNPYEYKQLSEDEEQNPLEVFSGVKFDKQHGEAQVKSWAQVQKAAVITIDLKI